MNINNTKALKTMHVIVGGVFQVSDRSGAIITEITTYRTNTLTNLESTAGGQRKLISILFFHFNEVDCVTSCRTSNSCWQTVK